MRSKGGTGLEACRYLRQECLPHLPIRNPWNSRKDSLFTGICCRITDRMSALNKHRDRGAVLAPPPDVGNASGRKMSLRERGIYYQTKPTGLLESTKSCFAKPKKVQLYRSYSHVQAPNSQVYYCQMGEMRQLAKWEVYSSTTMFTQTLKLLYPAGF